MAVGWSCCAGLFFAEMLCWIILRGQLWGWFYLTFEGVYPRNWSNRFGLFWLLNIACFKASTCAVYQQRTLCKHCIVELHVRGGSDLLMNGVTLQSDTLQATTILCPVLARESLHLHIARLWKDLHLQEIRH